MPADVADTVEVVGVVFVTGAVAETGVVAVAVVVAGAVPEAAAAAYENEPGLDGREEVDELTAGDALMCEAGGPDLAGVCELEAAERATLAYVMVGRVGCDDMIGFGTLSDASGWLSRWIVVGGKCPRSHLSGDYLVRYPCAAYSFSAEHWRVLDRRSTVDVLLVKAPFGKTLNIPAMVIKC